MSDLFEGPATAPRPDGAKQRPSRPTPAPTHPARPKRTYLTPQGAIADWARIQGRPPDCQWAYLDAEGTAVGLVLRWDDPVARKVMRPVARDPRSGRWFKGGMPQPRPLYGLLRLLRASLDTTVFVVEGERCADAGAACGLLTTTSAHGAGSAGLTDWSPFHGRYVVIMPDHDEGGEQYAQAVLELATVAGAASVVVARLVDVWPEIPHGGDIADLLECLGGDVDAVRERVESLVPTGAGVCQ